MNSSFPCRINAAHPSLPGHFPGQPVVPGVVLLSEVVSVAESLLGSAIQVVNISAAKFTHPLLPETDFQISLQVENSNIVKFRCMQGETMLTNGSFRFELTSAQEKF